MTVTSTLLTGLRRFAPQQLEAAPTSAASTTTQTAPSDVVPYDPPLITGDPDPRALRAPEVLETATIGCVIPAYNEESSIRQTLESLLAQTRPPEDIYVIANNCTDDTVWEASKLEGLHVRDRRGQEYRSTVHVIDIGKNPDKKIGALNKGWELARGHTFILGVDGDAVLHEDCVEYLEAEMLDDSRIGGISAIYSIDMDQATGPAAKFLLAAQRNQFAGFNMDNLLRNRNMAVLGGQASLFRRDALIMLMHRYHQSHPWTNDSEVEDSLLSLQIRDVGYLTKISAHARAYVGGMPTFRALYAQQVKWTAGGIELMKQRPFHPNLRLRWRENVSMVFNIATRLLFALLLMASLSVGAFSPHPVWLIPPVTAWLLNLRITATMSDRSWVDWLYSALFFPTEMYMWMRGTYFAVSWWQVLSKVEKDNWGAQAAAESGKGGAGWLWPVAALGVVGVLSYYSWTNMEPIVQAYVLGIGWPILGLVSTVLTLGMLKKLMRRHRGFTV